MPKSTTVWHGIEGKYFLHSTIAVRRDDENLTWKIAIIVRDPHDNIVMELTLFPVIEQFISPKACAYFFEQSAQNEGISQFLNDEVHTH